ncbi:MAG: hypothetical protein ACI9DJ_000304 [Algoriphagus sp.]|jgi:hypothetical protein
MEKKLKLFTAYVQYKNDVWLVENGLWVKGYLAQLHKGRIRPIFVGLNLKERNTAFDLIKHDKAALNRENYKSLLPYMVEMKMEGRVQCFDLDDPLGPNKMYLRLDGPRVV